MAIQLDKYMVRCDDLAWRMYDGEAVIMTDGGSQIHTLNKVASFIWELADGKLTVKEIAARVYDRFDIVEDTAIADTLEFAQQLADKGIVMFSDQPPNEANESGSTTET